VGETTIERKIGRKDQVKGNEGELEKNGWPLKQEGQGYTQKKPSERGKRTEE